MDISHLGQCFASAVCYIQNHSGIEAPPYFDKVPEAFMVPSVYFPVPRVICRKATLASYRSTVIMECWFMAADEWEAYRHALIVRDCLLEDRCAIPVLKKDGSRDRWAVRITEPEVRKVDTRTVKLAFDLKHYFSFQPENGAKAENILFHSFVKTNMLRQIWTDATAGQRIEKEARRECQKNMTEGQ